MEIFHVLSRGVDKRKIFLDKQDYLRFIHDLFEFNDTSPSNNVFHHFSGNNNDIVSRYITKKERLERKLLVDIHAFCLMPNHYHILLSPRIDNGVSMFMRK